MKEKKSMSLVATEFTALSQKSNLSKEEKKQLKLLRRTLESYGIKPQDGNLIEYATLVDCSTQVKGYVASANVTKSKREELARDFRELVVITDPKRLSGMLNRITVNKKTADKLKDLKVRGNKLIISEEAEEQPERIREVEVIIDEFNEKDLLPADVIDDINAFAEKAFLTA